MGEFIPFGFFMGGWFLWFFILSVPWAVGCFFLAPRLGENKYIWVVLSLIPFVNIWIFFPYALFTVLYRHFDRQKKILKVLVPAQPSKPKTRVIMD